MRGYAEELSYQSPEQATTSHTVGKIIWHNHLKEISFTDVASSFKLPRSACVSVGDQVVLKGESAWVICENGEAQLLPSYVARETISIGPLNLEFVIKEITEQEEFTAYQALAHMHYRQNTLCGRTARLIVRNFHPIYPQVVGYIELATPLYMNKARSSFLDTPFQADGISWESWDVPTFRRYNHLIVRIARCVVYPEFRGLGLGQVLVKHAAEFARHRWHLAHLKPLFLEISADMLKFVPFAQKAGMVFIGETAGNLERVYKDIEHLLRQKESVTSNYDVSIVNQQAIRFRRVQATMEREGLAPEELLERLHGLSSRKTLHHFNLFYDIVSLPKPTYLQGLTLEAERFVQQRATEVVPQNNHALPPIHLEPIKGPIVLQDISLTYQSRVRRTWHTHAIQQAFGISPDEIYHKVIHDLSLTIEPGQVLLLTGPSGSGKTTLLRLLSERTLLGLSGVTEWPDNYNPGTFAHIRSQKALIELLGRSDVSAAMHLLGIVGLSDAFVYLKRFNELSNGQQYRAMLAQLIAGNSNVWLADEFCANLDALTANVIADRLQRVARKLRAVLIVASSQPETFAGALQPDTVVHLTTAWEHRIIKGSAFLRALPNHRGTFGPPSLSISAEYLPTIRSGLKTTTIRKGRLHIDTGLLLLTTRVDFEAVNVVGTRQTPLRCLTDEDARKDGFQNLADLQQALRRHYPNLTLNSWVTVVAFEPLCSSR